MGKRIVMAVCEHCHEPFPLKRSWVKRRYCGRTCAGLASAAQRRAKGMSGLPRKGDIHRRRVCELLSGRSKLDAFLTGVRIGYWRRVREENGGSITRLGIPASL